MPYQGLLSVVIPVYRSHDYLRRTVLSYKAFLENHGNYEFVLVNDGSPDGVQGVLLELHSEDARCRYIELGTNLGQHRALLYGLAAARGDVVVTVDDDGQNTPASALRVVEALQQHDHDVVYGRYPTPRQKRHRVFASRLNAWITRYAIGNHSNVAVSNLRAMRGDLARTLGRNKGAYPYLDAMIFAATRRIADVPVEHVPRAKGASTYSLSSLVNLFLSHVTSLSALPLKVAALGCFGVALFTTLLGVAEVGRSLYVGTAPAGWLTLMCVLTSFFGLLFAFLGIMGIYVARMYITQNARDLAWVRSKALGEEDLCDSPREAEDQYERAGYQVARLNVQQHHDDGRVPVR